MSMFMYVYDVSDECTHKCMCTCVHTVQAYVLE